MTSGTQQKENEKISVRTKKCTNTNSTSLPPILPTPAKKGKKKEQKLHDSYSC
jgi:hypothetical protein